MKYFPFNLEQLKILQVVKNEITLKEAAKKLYLSQPTLSLHIQKLEYKINSPILDRNQKQICFTITGELILDYAERILCLCEEAKRALVYLKNLKSISLTIGCNETLGTYILPKIINLFWKLYPSARIKLEIDSTNSISWNIIYNKVDIGIVVEEEIPNDLYKLLYSKVYFKEEIILILSKSHKLQDVDNITIDHLYNLDYIALKSYSLGRKFIDHILKKFNIDSERLKIKFELNSIEAIKRAVQAGLGVSFVSILTVKDELYSKRLHSITISHIKMHKRLTIIVNPKTYQPPLSIKFYKYCFNILKTNSYIKFLNLRLRK